jgi:hypothetical protein
MAVHNARSSDEPSSDSDPMPTPVNFSIEIVDGVLKAITAWDDDGQSYTVSLMLTDNAQGDLCCCSRPNGTMICLNVTDCPCAPP